MTATCTKEVLTKLKRWWQSRRRHPDSPIVTDDDGFSFAMTSGDECHVRWKDISEIRVFKVDLFVTDEVRFSFKVGPERLVEASEEQHGFCEMVENLQRRFPTVLGWRGVIRPAFARNDTVLYEAARIEPSRQVESA